MTRLAGILTLGSAHRILVAALVTVAFTFLARFSRGVTSPGAAAGAFVGFALYAGAGFGAFLALVTVFVLTWLATRLGYAHKQQLGTAERKEGRTASQVLANLMTAGLAAGLYGLYRGEPVFLIAMAAALSEAAADTVSSEFGQAYSDRARLITNWKPVPAGTDGGVTWAGTAAGAAAAVIVSAVCIVTHLLPTRWWALPVIGAVAGMIADSYMGALLEQRRWLNNNGVNFLGTVVAAAISCFLFEALNR